MKLTADVVAALPSFCDIATTMNRDPYKDSIFLPLKQLSSRTKGAVFEKMVEEYLAANGDYVVTKPLSSNYDRIINDKRVEIKGSFLWGTSGNFRWQQIRTNQAYDIIVFMAIYPDRIELFAATKEDVVKFIEVQDDNGNWIYNQHGGKRTNSGTFFLDGTPDMFPFMKPLEEIL